MTGLSVSLKFVVLGLLASAIALIAPREMADLLVLLWSVCCSITVLAFGQRMQNPAKSTYVLLGFAGLVILVGTVIRTLHGEAVGIEQPLPSPADLFHVPGYLMFVAVAFRIHRARARHRDLDAWLDAMAMSLSLGAICWALFLGDFVLDAEDSPLAVTLHAGYNALIFLAVAVVFRIGATPGPRTRTYQFLGVACGSFFAADLYATWASTADQTPYLTIALSPLIYGFGAGAVAHTTAEETLDPSLRAETESTESRTAFVLLSLIAPVLVVVAASQASGLTRGIALSASVIAATLVSTRVYRLLRSESTARGKERQLSVELRNLTRLDSVEDIIAHLPGAATRILPAGHHIQLSTDLPKGSGTYPLAASFGQANRALVISPSIATEHDKRLIHSLTRDAGHLATALTARSAIERQRTQTELNKQIAADERRFRALVQNSTDVVAVLNSAGEVTYISESCERVLGYPPERFVGENLEWVAHENDWNFARNYLRATLNGTESHREHEVRALHKDGSVKLLECLITDMRDIEEVGGLVVNVTDVTEKRTLERNLRDAEITDSLTLLLNRNAFIREADAAIRRSSVSNNGVAMAIINLDDFRLINEGYGTSIADELLVELSHRVRQAVRTEDSVARLNGDEFGILMPDGYSSVEAESVVERILEEVTEPIEVAGRTIALRATAGLVMNEDDSATGISLLRDADTALDAAKQTNRGGLLKFDDAMGEEVSERVLLRNMLNEAIQTNQLRLAFQPIVDMETGSIVSMEALSRWHDADRGDIPPNTFIPIAEATGMISELGEWALRTACTHVVEWAEQGFDDFTVSVNMSGHQLREENMISEVQRVLEETGVDPSRMTIEITESVLIDDTDFIADRIRALRDLGLRLAIDDFGTGYSSLSYLRRYEFDVLKIDRSFVIPLANDVNKREREIVNAMIKLAQALGAVTVAEGIEENEEYAVLRTLGCDYAQGYLFWYPTEADDVIEVLNSQTERKRAA